jgi:phosphate transport system protein
MEKSQQALQELSHHILSMGSDVEKAMDKVRGMILHFDPEEFHKLFQIETIINKKHLLIDELSVELIAQHSPKASDLRRVFAISKINADLERIGDQCRNCAFILRDLYHAQACSMGDLAQEFPELKKDLLLEMLRLVNKMVQVGLDGFSLLETSKMKEVLEVDNQVDEIRNEILLVCKKYLLEGSKKVDFFLDMMMLAKNIERIGDHATNIAEDVIYVCTGTDIRHGGFLKHGSF